MCSRISRMVMTSLSDGISPQGITPILQNHYSATANSNSSVSGVVVVPSIPSTKHCAHISGRTAWNIKTSKLAKRTINRIRGIVETLKLTPNPNKPMIPLSIGEYNIYRFHLKYNWNLNVKENTKRR